MKPNKFIDPIQITRTILPDFEQVQDKLREIWKSGWLTNNGAKVCELNQKLKEHTGASNFAVFSNGTIALEITLKALGVTGEVITTPFTFPATVHAITAAGAKPVFVDIESNQMNINADLIEAAITSETTAIVPVHVFGNPAEVYRIESIARKHNLKVVYDAAHAFGVSIDGIPVACFGDASMFSFHATKIFHCVEGGGISAKDPCLIKALELWRNFGLVDGEKVLVPGTNAKMNELQAAIGLVTLDMVAEETSKRLKNIELYKKLLKKHAGIRIICPSSNVTHNAYNLPILVDADQLGITRDRLHSELKQFNIFSRRYFYPLCSQYECYRYLADYSNLNLPVAEQLVERILCLPLYGDLTVDEIEGICSAIDWIANQDMNAKNIAV